MHCWNINKSWINYYFLTHHVWLHRWRHEICYMVYLCSRRGQFTIVPILVGSLTLDREQSYGQLLARYLADPENLFVISSDFCHWGQLSLTKHFNVVWVLTKGQWSLLGIAVARRVPQLQQGDNSHYKGLGRGCAPRKKLKSSVFAVLNSEYTLMLLALVMKPKLVWASEKNE